MPRSTRRGIRPWYRKAQWGLRPLTLASLGLAMRQGSGFAFLTTYLTDAIGLSLALTGAVFSVAQMASFAGRIVVGVIADRLGSTRRMLVVMALASSATLVLVAPPPFGAMVWLAGYGAAHQLVAALVLTWGEVLVLARR